MTQKPYGISTRKLPTAQVTNGTPFHVKAEKSLALNVNADTDTCKKDHYYPAAQKTAIETIKDKLAFHFHPTRSVRLI
jgi:hypothetical protein